MVYGESAIPRRTVCQTKENNMSNEVVDYETVDGVLNQFAKRDPASYLVWGSKISLAFCPLDLARSLIRSFNFERVEVEQ